MSRGTGLFSFTTSETLADPIPFALRGVPFGGYKESGGGREEDVQELMSFTQTKTVNVSLAR